VNYELPAEIADLKSRTRAFVDRYLIPEELRLSRSHKLAPETQARLEEVARNEGLAQLGVPREFGGQGAGLLSRVVVWEELARTTALPTRGQTIFGPEVSPILFHLRDGQRERFLYPVLRGEKRTAFAQTEPEAGSDPAGMRTTAVRDGDCYVLNGEKRFIGFVDEADFLQVLAATDTEKRARGGISAFLVPVDTPGVRIVRQLETMMRDRPFELRFENVRVPVENRIGEDGEGFAFGQQWLTEGRIRHAARAIGVIERCLELASTRASSRKTFGAPLADRQAVQWMLVDMYVHLRQLRLMTYTTAASYDAGRDVRFDSYMCKFFGDETSFAAADRCMQIYGGLGLTTDLPIESFWRDQRSMIITEGPTEVLKMALARHVVRKYAKGADE
jgi:acyl-CoA dehydrogenase